MRLDPDSRTSQETLTDRTRKSRRRRTRNDRNGTGAHDRERAAKATGRNGQSANPVADGAGTDTATRAPMQGLTSEQIERLEKRLLDERARAIRTLWAKRVDMEDHRAAGTLDEVELDIRMAERHSEFLGLINDALRRLHDSPTDFDISVVSGARIPFERLEMVPWTRRLTEEVGSAHD